MLRAWLTALVIASLVPVGCQAGRLITDTAAEYEYMGVYEISSYNVYEGGGENFYTASGMQPQAWYTVATASDIPFGTVLYIEDVGEVVVADRGGPTIESGERIDLFVGYDDCDVWGLQDKAVYLKKE